MKIIVINLFFISCIFLLGFTNAHKNVSFSIPIQLILNEEEEEFVELMDGKIIKGNVTKFNLLKTNNFQKRFEGSVIIDGVTYQYADVMAVQYKKKYFRKTPYNEFAMRTTRGKINRYVSSQVSGSSAPFMQKGDKGVLYLMSVDNLRELASDYKPVIDFLNNYEKLSERQKRKAMLPTYEGIEIYNNQ